MRRPTCRRRPTRRPRPRRKGIWRSIFYSAVGGWILLLAFLFAVQDKDAITKGGGGVDLIFGQALGQGWHVTVLAISVAGQFF